MDTVDDVVQRVFTSEEEACQWSKDEEKKDRIVEGYIHKKTGKYIRKSIPKEAVFIPSNGEIHNLVEEKGENGRLIIDD